MRWQLASTFAVTAMSSGCYGPATRECANGFLCPAGFECAAEGHCGKAAPVAACLGEGISDYHQCDEPTGGTCRYGVCESCSIDRAGCPTDGFQAMAKPGDDNLFAVWVGRRDLAFAVGEAGVTWRYDGWEWKVFPSAALNSNSSKLAGIWGTDEANLYAVSDGDQILKWNGAGWTEVKATAMNLTGVAGTSATDVTVVGADSKVAELAGSDWVISTAYATQLLSLNAAFGIGEETYVAGAYGAVLRKQRGAAWTEVRAWNASALPLQAIWASSADDIVVAGDEETLMQGPNWTPIPLDGIPVGTTINLRGVWGNEREVFVVGDNGTVVHRRDNVWIQFQPNTLPPAVDLTGISGADGVVFVVGAAGTIWRYAPAP